MLTVSSPTPLTALVHRLAKSPSLAAVALVGSRANGISEPNSDFDVFVYMDGDAQLGDLRTSLAQEFADPAAWKSTQERAFGDGDVWRLRTLRDGWTSCTGRPPGRCPTAAGARRSQSIARLFDSVLAIHSGRHSTLRARRLASRTATVGTTALSRGAAPKYCPPQPPLFTRSPLLVPASNSQSD